MAADRTAHSGGARIVRGLRFLAVTVLVWLVTHAVAYLAHEYSHTFVAWALGWKDDPLILNFGDASAGNLLLLLQISERVDYDPIFATGHGAAAAAIAAAGVVIGNGLLLILSWRAFDASARSARPGLALVPYWLAVMCVGNFLSYVPVRTFAQSGDMSLVERGLAISPWAVVVVLGLPFAYGMWMLFSRLLPRIARLLDDRDRAIVTIVATASTVFGFFGAAGFESLHSPHVRSILSLISIGLILPISLAWCLYRHVREGRPSTPRTAR